jgi:type II secretory pathway pseudopilin PulG
MKLQDMNSMHASPATGQTAAFSLIEVMVALAIFFMAVFAILGLMSTLLQNARVFQSKRPPEARMIFAYQTSITNRVIEGSIDFDFSEMADFGDEFRDYRAEVEAYPNEMYTNGLWDVQYRVVDRRTGRVESTFTTFQFDPNTKSKQLSGGLGR